jgi:hypothetical protein
MTAFEVNLIRDRTPAPARRKALYWGLLVYLGLCGMLLVTVVYIDTYRMITAIEYQREAAAIRRAFAERYPQQEDAISLAKSLQEGLEEDLAKVKSIEDLVDRSAHLTRILLGLTIPMSRDVVLNELRLDQETGRLVFTLSVPEAEARKAMDLIAVWNSSANLNREVTRFRTLSRNQTVEGGRVMVLMEVEATLRGKGA